ncbi:MULTISPECIES: inorganic phosphate transporter [Niveibacterium]|uniref:Inorganic phosphate transporter n=1 Tax=Niveibacterium microcysteis TaxID=2811415 RepID=A0ABX7M5Q9_9RHOO|nr:MULTISPECIES: inorganic phosphate transporter [Niveibacterium]QSI76078.1 inorganic phosphate transporter [Niveibacterium microcysteis]
MTFEVLLVLLALALLFDFMNGFHDAANSIATVVSTGVLRPQWAVLFAAFFNFVAYFLFPLKVAATIGKGTIDPSIVDHYVIFGALMGAIVWNLITWWYGIPSSSSHALIGGLVGAAVAKSGTDSLIASGVLKTVAFIVVSPMLGMLLGSLLMLAVSWIFFRTAPRRVDKWFRRLQLMSAALYSLGHGGNDAQKTAGIIWMMLVAATVSHPEMVPHWMQATPDHLPHWVVIACYVMIGLGTMFGGWRIVKTMGQKLTKLKPVGGFCAETGGAMTLFLATSLGIPVSTTHTITGAIVGVGSCNNVKAVRWGVAGNIVWAWILTIPCSAFVAALSWEIGRRIF